MLMFYTFSLGDRVMLRDGSATGTIVSMLRTKIGARAAVVRWDDPSTRRALRLCYDLAPVAERVEA